jgi:pimeloyl-ACP methyl ester carboxylesterase
MQCPSFAVDLPGRGSRPADLTRVTTEDAAASVAADVRDAVPGDVMLVGHSVAGTLIPAASARLGGHVRHLVFLAGITAADGELPLEVFLPGQAARVAAQLDDVRERYRGHTLEMIGVKQGSSIDSLNLCSQPMSWAGVPDALPRTFVRCLRDQIQSRAVQDQFIANCRATAVIDIDTGHTPAIEAPEELARVIDAIAGQVPT